MQTRKEKVGGPAASGSEKEEELFGVARHLSSNICLKRSRSIIYKSLISKEEKMAEKTGKEKSQLFMACIGKTKPLNFLQRKQGKDLPPRLIGYFPYKPM
jgi:hypothetical protein